MSDLHGNPEDLFSRVAAHRMIRYLHTFSASGPYYFGMVSGERTDLLET